MESGKQVILTNIAKFGVFTQFSSVVYENGPLP